MVPLSVVPRSHAARWFRPAGALALAASAALSIAACGGGEATAVTTVSPYRGACALPATAVALALHADATLLRHRSARCVFGSPSSPARAAEDAPLATIERKDQTLGELHTAIDPDADTIITPRPDLADNAFAVERKGRKDRRRATLVFRRGQEVWVITVEVAAGQFARQDAMEGAEGLFDAMLAAEAPGVTTPTT